LRTLYAPLNGGPYMPWEGNGHAQIHANGALFTLCFSLVEGYALCHSQGPDFRIFDYHIARHPPAMLPTRLANRLRVSEPGAYCMKSRRETFR
jgi:hypothetical protein